MATDARLIGRRIAEARGRASLTQADLAAAISLDRSALAKVETGARRVSAVELASVADVLNQRVEWFLDLGPRAIVSRRSTEEPGTPSPAIDANVERIARNVEFVIKHDSHFRATSPQPISLPTSNSEADSASRVARGLLGLNDVEPLNGIADRVGRLGLWSFCFEMEKDSADAALIHLDAGGVALINGSLAVGRRRLALAHELGHFLFADEYVVDWKVGDQHGSDANEALIDRFARSLLLPGPGLRAIWHDSTKTGDLRSTTVRVASHYSVDMATLARRLIELKLVDASDADRVRGTRTTRADIVEANLVVNYELAPPNLPSDYERAVVRLFRSETISSARALDLLFDTWSEEDLPALDTLPENTIWNFVA